MYMYVYVFMYVCMYVCIVRFCGCVTLTLLGPIVKTAGTLNVN